MSTSSKTATAASEKGCKVRKTAAASLLRPTTGVGGGRSALVDFCYRLGCLRNSILRCRGAAWNVLPARILR